MSAPSSSPQVPAPRVLLVLSGAASVVGRGRTPLEEAAMAQLAIVAHSGRAGRLRTIPSHLPASKTTAAASLLGAVPPSLVDPGAVAAESLGISLAPDETCTVVEICDLTGDPAPALDVQRAVEAFRGQLHWHRVVGLRRSNEILVAGVTRPVLPQLEGLLLNTEAYGIQPIRSLDDRTQVIATEGSTLLGVAGLLGARVTAVDGRLAARHDPIPGRLRDRTIQALIAGARTVVVETSAPLTARTGPRGDQLTRHRAIVRALERVDRELIGPLRTACDWTGATFAVAADLPRGPGGRPERGPVPMVISGPRSVSIPETAPLLAPLGTTLPPNYSERGVASLPLSPSPFTVLAPRELLGPARFKRDPSGVTVPTNEPLALL